MAQSVCLLPELSFSKRRLFHSDLLPTYIQFLQIPLHSLLDPATQLHRAPLRVKLFPQSVLIKPSVFMCS